MFTEAKARLAGQVAAADAICEYADRLRSRDVARMCGRMDRLQHSHRTAIARRTGKAVH
jgi:hypothetical protein